MTDGNLAAKCNMWKHLLHYQCCIHRLARAKMQKIDVETVSLIRKIRGYPDRQAFGVRRPRGAVCGQSGELALAFDNLCVRVENFGELAVQTDTDVRSFIGKFLHEALC